MGKRDDAAERSRASRTLDHEQLKAALATVWHLPRTWVALLLLTALFACLDVARQATGEWTIRFSVRPAVLIALALVWLPVVLRLLLLSGGTLKAGGVEASTTGILDGEQLLQLLTRAKVVTMPQSDDRVRAAELVQLESVVSTLASDAFVGRSLLDDEHLHSLAREYERLRRDLSPGPQRTTAMTWIVSEVRVRASSSLELAVDKAGALLRSRSSGERLVGLALAQEVGSSDLFAVTLRLVQESDSAFEMFHALLAIQEMASRLSESRQREATTALRRELQDPRGVGVCEDAGLMLVLGRTIAALGGDA